MSPPQQRPPRSRLLYELAPWLVASLCALAMTHGLLRCGACLGSGDWDYFTAQALVSRSAVIEHGQLPTWNPYHCGGMPVADNFQSRTFTPTFLLVLAFGPIWGLRVWAIALIAIGFEGGRRLARAIGAGRWGAAFAALAIACNGHVALHLAVGHMTLLTFLLSPWLLLATLRAEREPHRAAVTFAWWMALGLVEGGLQPMLYACCACGAVAIVRSYRQRTAAPLLTVASGVAGACGLSAVLLVSALPHLMRIDTAVTGVDHFAPGGLGPALFGLAQRHDAMDRFAEQVYAWHEYGTYVGPLFPVLCVLGAWKARGRSSALLAAGVLALALALGDHGAASPWSLLQHVPPFGSTRVPSRLLVYAVMCFALAGALGLDRVPKLAAPLVMCFGLNLLWVVSPLSSAGAAHPIDLQPGREAFAQFPTQEDMERGATLHTPHTLNALHKFGNLLCYDPAPPATYARPLPRGHNQLELQRPEGPAEGHARFTAFSPTRWQIEVAGVAEDAALIVNQNFDAGWQRKDGEPVRSASGRIGTVVTQSTRSVELSFRPLPLYAGALLSVLTALVLVRIGRKSRS